MRQSLNPGSKLRCASLLLCSSIPRVFSLVRHHLGTTRITGFASRYIREVFQFPVLREVGLSLGDCRGNCNLCARNYVLHPPGMGVGKRLFLPGFPFPRYHLFRL